MSNPEFISKQIYVAKNGKRLVEVMDKLTPAPLCSFAHIHACYNSYPKSYEDDKHYSLIQLAIEQYEPKKRVYFNLSPMDIKYLYWCVQKNPENFKHAKDKIYGYPDKEGLCTTNKLEIRYQLTDQNGQTYNNPWYITIDNGRGIKEKTNTGGYKIKSGSFRSEKKLSQRLSDEVLFMLLESTLTYIRIWENTYGPQLMIDANMRYRELLEQKKNSEEF